MTRNISRLSTTNYDAIIVGGGISGAWLALHCVESGLKVALIEQGDFASKTSSASSKLLHGGIRYLQQMQFDKVRESALERAHYLYAAPHLSVPVPFAVPTYKDFKRSKFFLNCGMLAYRLLCLGENKISEGRFTKLPPIKSISSNQLNGIYDLSPTKHTGAVVFHECHLYDSERMVLSVLKTAQKKGAHIYNYVAAKNLITQGKRITGIQALDTLTNEPLTLQSQLVINAAGPWIDNINSLIKTNNNPSITGFAVGSHVITRQQITDHAIAITTKQQSNAKIDRGGRHVFIIPWRGHSLIGTSYGEIDNPNQSTEIKADDVKQLLNAVNQALPNIKLRSTDLISAYSGLYPLRTDNIKHSVYQGSGEYQIIDHAHEDGTEGLITALGAKFTTGRILSKKTMPLITNKLVNNQCAKTNNKTILHNSNYTNYPDFLAEKKSEYTALFKPKIIEHLVRNYGSEVDDFIAFLDTDESYKKPINPDQPDIVGQVAWAIQYEMAFSLEDVLYRRTSLGLLGITNPEIQLVANLMAKLLDWDDDTLQHQLKHIKQKRELVEEALASYHYVE